MAIEGSGVPAKAIANMIRKEQRFRSARPLKAADEFVIEHELTLAGTPAENDEYAFCVVPDDLGPIFLTGLAVYCGEAADSFDALNIINIPTDDAPTGVGSSCVVVLADSAEIGGSNVACISDVKTLQGFRAVNLAGATLSLVADAAIATGTFSVRATFQVERTVDPGADETITT